MALAQDIQKDFITARKSKDEDAVKVLTMVHSAIRNKEIEQKSELKEDEILTILNKEIKQRKDSIEQYTKGGRKELADSEQKEIDLLQKYLPEQMSEEEVGKIIDSAISDTGATSMADIGKVMGKIMPQVKGKADGSLVQKLVQQKLTNK